MKLPIRSSNFFRSSLAAALAIVSFAPSVNAQLVHPLEPVSAHYEKQASLSSAPDSARAALDRIEYPWTEYSKNALTNSLLRSVYLLPEDEPKLVVAVRFPANSSARTRAELDFLLELQAKRTPEQIARAEVLAKIGSWPQIVNPTDPDYAENRQHLFHIGAALGDWFNPANFPETTDLLMGCIQDIRATEFRLKRHFVRPRPYHLEERLKPLARINSPAFVSGHTLWAFAQALLFSEIVPEKRAEFLKRAEEIRWSRELLGIHYPSDNEGARVVAWHLLEAWHRNPKFVADLQKAKIEWMAKKASFAASK